MSKHKSQDYKIIALNYYLLYIYMEFREITLKDKSDILYLLSQLTKTEPIPDSQFNTFINNKHPSHSIYVISVNEQIVGVGTVIIEPKIIRGMKNVGHIEDIVIDKKYRGKGYGIKLVEFLITLCQKENCYKVILDCDYKVKHFYEKCGLSQKGICMGYYF